MTSALASTIREHSSDEEIVRRIVGGDAALFEILMRRHNQRIYRAVRAVLRADDDAEDVMQQAYLNAYQHLHQFAGDAQFSTWLTRIALRRPRQTAPAPRPGHAPREPLPARGRDAGVAVRIRERTVRPGGGGGDGADLGASREPLAP